MKQPKEIDIVKLRLVYADKLSPQTVEKLIYMSYLAELHPMMKSQLLEMMMTSYNDGHRRGTILGFASAFIGLGIVFMAPLLWLLLKLAWAYTTLWYQTNPTLFIIRVTALVFIIVALLWPIWSMGKRKQPDSDGVHISD